ILAPLVRRQIQNADTGDSWPERLPTGCERRISTLHHPPAIKDSVEDVVFPGRRSLGAQAAELAALVQNGERLGRSVVQKINPTVYLKSQIPSTKSQGSTNLQYPNWGARGFFWGLKFEDSLEFGFWDLS